MAHCFVELCKPLIHDKAVIHEGENKFNSIFFLKKDFCSLNETEKTSHNVVNMFIRTITKNKFLKINKNK